MKWYLDLPGHQHGMEAGLDLEDAPSSFGYELRSQNDDETPALVDATSQVLDVGCGAEPEMKRWSYFTRREKETLFLLPRSLSLTH